MYTVFSIYAKQLKKFAEQYSLKKFTVIPELNETKKLTNRDIVRSIQNAKLMGVNRKMKGSPLQIFANLFIMKIIKIRFRKMT